MSSTGKSLLDELRSFDKGGLFDLGHPLLNRVVESFVKAAGVGAIQAASRLGYLTMMEGSGTSADNSSGAADLTGSKRHPRLNSFKGETSAKSVEALVSTVKNAGMESLQWGLAAGMYSGLSYGLKEATGSYDWKNSAVAGAVTGAALALTADCGASHEQIVQCAITGAALSTAANLLSGIL